MVVAMAAVRIMGDLRTGVIQAPSLWKWAIGLTTAHGAGYYVGRTYYVWKPGHWVVRNGQRVWIHGHYVVRGRY